VIVLKQMAAAGRMVVTMVTGMLTLMWFRLMFSYLVVLYWISGEFLTTRYVQLLMV